MYKDIFNWIQGLMEKLGVGRKDEDSLSSSSTEPGNGFVERMKVCAELAGSATALAKRAGVSQSGIRRYFSGGEPTRPQLIAIARAVEVRVAWLATGELPMCDVGGPAPSEDVTRGLGASKGSNALGSVAKGGRQSTRMASSPFMTLYARLVAPLHELTSVNEREREWVLQCTLDILRATAADSNADITDFSADQLRQAVGLAASAYTTHGAS